MIKKEGTKLSNRNSLHRSVLYLLDYYVEMFCSWNIYTPHYVSAGRKPNRKPTKSEHSAALMRRNDGEELCVFPLIPEVAVSNHVFGIFVLHNSISGCLMKEKK